MKYIFFPGNSVFNKEWIEKLANEFHDKDKAVISYNHWEIGEKQIDFNRELRNIELLNIQDDCIAICKSAGCYLSYLSSKNNYLNIKKFIFIGYPYLWLEDLRLDPLEALKFLNDKILIIQKKKDPVIGSEELVKILNENNIQEKLIKYTRKGEPDDTHSYDDTKFLMEVIEEYSKR